MNEFLIGQTLQALISERHAQAERARLIRAANTRRTFRFPFLGWRDTRRQPEIPVSAIATALSVGAAR